MWSIETIRRMNADADRKAQRRRERRRASSPAVEGADELLALVPAVGDLLDAVISDQGDQVDSSDASDASDSND